MEKELPYLSIDKLDPNWCLEQCKYIAVSYTHLTLPTTPYV